MTLVYQSTRDEKNRVTASQAILQGLATDGGLFTPITYPQIDLDFAKLKDASYQEVAKLVLSTFLDDFSEAELDRCINHAYDSKFDDAAMLPWSSWMVSTIQSFSTERPLPSRTWLCLSCLT